MSRASNPLISLSVLSLFSLCLSAAIAGTASHVLYSYQTQRATNLWWLPIWKTHFDARGTETLIGASASLIVLNLLICSATLVKASLARVFILALATIGAIAALVEIAYPAAINNAAPGTDTMQTWTCQWASAENSPDNFSALCHESRFAYFASIPVFVTQILILGLAVQNLFVSRWQSGVHEEKGDELGSIMATESRNDGGFRYDNTSGKGSPEIHVYGRGSP